MSQRHKVPPREPWPEPLPHTEEGRLLTEVIVTTFRLNRSLLDVAEGLAADGEITAAWWQVIGGILDEPRTIPEIGRRMGMTRQAVQRVADLLVARGLAEYRPNPNHRRANLLACTKTGYWAIRRIALAQHPWANRIGAEVGAFGLRQTLKTMQRILSSLEADDRSQPEEQSAAEYVRGRPMGLAAGSRRETRHAAARSN
jgi:DNA-binding MarR family transcriptional regulator